MNILNTMGSRRKEYESKIEIHVILNWAFIYEYNSKMYKNEIYSNNSSYFRFRP